MNKDYVKITTMNKKIRLSANDLSLLNGVSEKINYEYLKNIESLIVYNVAEAVRDGASNVEVAIPPLGVLKVSLRDTFYTNKDKSNSVGISFSPSGVLQKSIVNAYETGDNNLPDLLADRYGKKLLRMYEKFLEE